MGLTDKLDLLMKERNINKADLARESGVPYTTIDGFYKKGSENAKLSTLKNYVLTLIVLWIIWLMMMSATSPPPSQLIRMVKISLLMN